MTESMEDSSVVNKLNSSFIDNIIDAVSRNTEALSMENDEQEINNDSNNDYPSDFDPNEYERIEFNKEHKKQMLLLLNKIIPDLNPLTSFKSSSSMSHKQLSKPISLTNDLILTRLTCLIKFFNDFFRPQEIWPLLGQLPIILYVDRTKKTLKFKDDLTIEKLNQLNKYIRCWLYLFYTCDEIIESIDIIECNTESMEMLTMLILNVFSHIRDSLPQIRRIFLDYWYPLEKFEQMLECFFRYDKIFQIIMKQLVRERLMSQIMREQNSKMSKLIDSKQKEIDRMHMQSQQQQSASTIQTNLNSKAILRKSRINPKPLNKNPETSSCKSVLSSVQNHKDEAQQITVQVTPTVLLPQIQPKSQLKSILLSNQRSRSPAPSIASDSCSNSVYSSGPSSPQTSITNGNSQVSIKDNNKPTSEELAEAVANKVHQTRCATSKAKAELANNENSKIIDTNKTKCPKSRGRPPRKSSAMDDSDDDITSNQTIPNKKAKISPKIDCESDSLLNHKPLLPRKRFKMKQSLLQTESMANNNNNDSIHSKNSPKSPVTVNAISQQQSGPLKPIVKMNSASIHGSKSLLIESNKNNKNSQTSKTSISNTDDKSQSLIIKSLQVKSESSSIQHSTIKIKNKFNIKADSGNLVPMKETNENNKTHECHQHHDSNEKSMKHSPNHTKNDNFRCDKCDKIFSTEKRKNRHMVSEHEDDSKHSHHCHLCKYESDSKETLLEHMCKVHGYESSSDDEFEQNKQLTNGTKINGNVAVSTFGPINVSTENDVKNVIKNDSEMVAPITLSDDDDDSNQNALTDDKESNESNHDLEIASKIIVADLD